MSLGSQYRAILWDNDGILVDTERLYFEATRQAVETVGFELTPALFREYFLHQAIGIWHLLEGQGLSSSDVEALRADRTRRYEAMLESGDWVMPGARATLEQLHGAIPMAIVTSCQPQHFAKIHRATDLLRYFEFALTREQYVESKPHPEPYLTAAQMLGVPARACLAIEDSARGLASATGAGMECWVIPTELSAGSDFSAAARQLSSIVDVGPLLRGNRCAT